ncbi:MAG: hypothetical protein WC548_02430 [Candidatus Pacearchaeota archaeon]
MVTNKQGIIRKDTVVRVSKWLDDVIENYISDRKIRLDFPSKRNFVDCAIMHFLEEKKVNLEGKNG